MREALLGALEIRVGSFEVGGAFEKGDFGREFIEMDKQDSVEQNVRIPYDFYDFFGYLLPGVVFSSALALYLIVHRHEKIVELVNLIPQSIRDKNSWIIITFMLALGWTYVIGHIIATASSMIFDRFMMRKTLGYPYEFLLDLREKDRSPENNKLLIIATNLLLIGLALEIIVFQATTIQDIANIPMIALFALWLLPISNRVTVMKIKALDKASKFLSRFLMKPVRYILITLFELWKPFHFEVAKGIQDKVKQITGLEPSSIGTENYWLTVLWLSHMRSPNYPLIRKFLALYGFARNMAMAFFLDVVSIIMLKLVLGIKESWLFDKLLIFFLLICAYVMLLRFLYLYVSYYSKYIFRDFYILHTLWQPPP